MQALRRYLVTGLVLWVPLGITIWVLTLIVSTLDQTLLLLPQRYRPEALLGFSIPVTSRMTNVRRTPSPGIEKPSSASGR